MKWIILVFELYPPKTHFRTLQSNVNTNSSFFLSHGEVPGEKNQQQTCVIHLQNSLSLCAGCWLLFSAQVWKGDWTQNGGPC